MYSDKSINRRKSMSTFKIRLVTGPTDNTFYRRMDVPRESYVDISETNRIQLKHGGKKWKTYVPVTDPKYIEEKKELISGLVFKSRKDAEKFMRDKKSTLEKLAKTNPTYKRYEIFTVTRRFMPDQCKLKYWSPKK